MTALPIARLPFFSWFQQSVPPTEPQLISVDDDLRREYVAQLIAAKGCVGEKGVQALMGLFPKDF